MRSLPFTANEINQSIPARFKRIARKFSSRVAVKCDAREWKYSELDRVSDQIARSIIHLSESVAQPIVLLFDHEVVVFSAILGVLKSGNFYVALDLDYPLSRSRHILNDLQSRLILTNSDHLSLAETISQGKCTVLNIDQLDEYAPARILDIKLISYDHIEAVFYTSGSTGQPKGVERSHENLLHRVWMETKDYQIQPEDKFSLIHNCSFGASQVDIFDALLNGAQLCLFDIRKQGVDKLITWLKEEEITFFHAPSDLFRLFIDVLSAEDFFPTLRQITPSGRLFKKDVERIRKHITPECKLIQRLASTETGMITRLIIDHQMVITDNVVPVGYPVGDAEILILDQAGKNLGFNQVGEIAVKSAYLAKGYWQRPEMTEKAFLPVADGSNRRMYRLGDIGRMHADGCVELIGRKDSQVKIRGYRVELGEVEAALLNQKEIKEAVVIVGGLDLDEKRIIAYIVPVDKSNFSTKNLRRALRDRLPDYMIPSILIPLDNLPLTDRNKIDLAALPDPGQQRPQLDDEYSPPISQTEVSLANIWSEVLHIQPVGVSDNFFELGGHSLSAVQAISRINSSFNIDLHLRALFDFPTITLLASAIDQKKEADSEFSPEHLDKALKLLGY